MEEAYFKGKFTLSLRYFDRVDNDTITCIVRKV